MNGWNGWMDKWMKRTDQGKRTKRERERVDGRLMSGSRSENVDWYLFESFFSFFEIWLARLFVCLSVCLFVFFFFWVLFFDLEVFLDSIFIVSHLLSFFFFLVWIFSFWHDRWIIYIKKNHTQTVKESKRGKEEQGGKKKKKTALLFILLFQNTGFRLKSKDEDQNYIHWQKHVLGPELHCFVLHRAILS